MAMHKTFKKGPHFFWSVMSVVMQAYAAREAGQGKLADMVMLPLSEKMIKKGVEDKLVKGAETLRLYLLILELQAKHADQLQVLQLDLDRRIHPEADSPLLPVGLERDRIRVRCFRELGKWVRAAEAYRAMIDRDSEEFSNYTGFVTTRAPFPACAGTRFVF